MLLHTDICLAASQASVCAQVKNLQCFQKTSRKTSSGKIMQKAGAA